MKIIMRIIYFSISLAVLVSINVLLSVAYSTTFYVDKDHAASNDSNSGTEFLPWKTIQYGVRQLNPGDILYVKKSILPYYEPYRRSSATSPNGLNAGGITVDVSGTLSNPIIIAGFPGERPVIDQKRGVTLFDHVLYQPDSSNKPLSGFFIMRGSHYITIKGFEITNTVSSGIFFDPAGGTEGNDGIIIENNLIHNIYGKHPLTGNTVDNVGGIRLDYANNCIVRNNVIHDIYRNDGTNPYTSQPFNLHSGIHGYKQSGCLIENNLVYNVSRCVYQKTPDLDGGDLNEVKRNEFFNCELAAYYAGVQGTGSAPGFNLKFYENIVYNSGGGVITLHNETSSQSNGVFVHNNTFHNVNNPVSITGNTGVEVYNNIFSGSNELEFATGYAPLQSNSLAFYDNNLYFNSANKWIVDRGNNAIFVEWRSLAEWKTAFSISSAPGFAADPDQNSITGDPMFIDAAGENFRLGVDSAATGIGRNGETLGAYGLSENIGVLRSQKINDLSVQ
jgi:hypothetical protein